MCAPMGYIETRLPNPGTSSGSDTTRVIVALARIGESVRAAAEALGAEPVRRQQAVAPAWRTSRAAAFSCGRVRCGGRLQRGTELAAGLDRFIAASLRSRLRKKFLTGRWSSGGQCGQDHGRYRASRACLTYSANATGAFPWHRGGTTGFAYSRREIGGLPSNGAVRRPALLADGGPEPATTRPCGCNPEP